MPISIKELALEFSKILIQNSKHHRFNKDSAEEICRSSMLIVQAFKNELEMSENKEGNESHKIIQILEIKKLSEIKPMDGEGVYVILDLNKNTIGLPLSLGAVYENKKNIKPHFYYFPIGKKRPKIIDEKDVLYWISGQPHYKVEKKNV